MTLKKIIPAIMAIFLVLSLVSCSGFFAPSDQDVIKAVTPAWNGFFAVPILKKESAKEFRYSDTLESENANKDQTISQKANFTLDRENNYLSCEGICSFDNFVDKPTGYTINGTINYRMSGSLEKNADDVSLELVFDLQYEGGPVHSIAFTLNNETEHKQQIRGLMVNGKPFKFKVEVAKDFFRFLQRVKMF